MELYGKVRQLRLVQNYECKEEIQTLFISFHFIESSSVNQVLYWGKMQKLNILWNKTFISSLSYDFGLEFEFILMLFFSNKIFLLKAHHIGEWWRTIEKCFFRKMQDIRYKYNVFFFLLFVWTIWNNAYCLCTDNYQEICIKTVSNHSKRERNQYLQNLAENLMQELSFLLKIVTILSIGNQN